MINSDNTILEREYFEYCKWIKRWDCAWDNLFTALIWFFVSCLQVPDPSICIEYRTLILEGCVFYYICLGPHNKYVLGFDLKEKGSQI